MTEFEGGTFPASAAIIEADFGYTTDELGYLIDHCIDGIDKTFLAAGETA